MSRLTSLTPASALETGHSTLAWLASSVIFSAGRSTSTTVDKAMRLMVGPSSPTMIDTLAVVWIAVGGVSFLVRSRARYCETQHAWAAPSSSSGFVPLPSAQRDALGKLPSRPEFGSASGREKGCQYVLI